MCHAPCMASYNIIYNINCMHIATYMYTHTFFYVIATGYIVTAVYDYYSYNVDTKSTQWDFSSVAS